MEIKPSDICHFLAMYYYMGVVRLPAKIDYWKTDHTFWPLHPPAQNIPRDKFLYIWRYLHLTGAAPDADEVLDVNDDDDDDDDDDEEEEEEEHRRRRREQRRRR